jgi:hypothetical protein
MGETEVISMAKPKRPARASKPPAQDKPATLKDLLDPAVLDKLKAQADQLKADEQEHRERQRAEAAEARKAEQKRLDNDFEHLLSNSSADWRKFK